MIETVGDVMRQIGRLKRQRGKVELASVRDEISWNERCRQMEALEKQISDLESLKVVENPQ